MYLFGRKPVFCNLVLCNYICGTQTGSKEIQEAHIVLPDLLKNSTTPEEKCQKLLKEGRPLRLRVNLLFTQAPARKSKRSFHYLILMVVTRRARGTQSMADWQLYKHLTAIHCRTSAMRVCVWPLAALIPACQCTAF